MTGYPYKLPQDIYDESLKIISNTYFSRREIDIISCLLSGRTGKTIASLLSIAPRTVETHTRNITSKLERSSREDIRDFVEKSGKLSIIRDYYDSLSIQCAFEKSLRAIAAKKKNNLTCLILYQQQQDQKNKPSLICLMEEHLRIAGITPFGESRKYLRDIFDCYQQREKEAFDYTICVVDESFLIEGKHNDFQGKGTPSSHPGTRTSGCFLFLLLPRESSVQIPQAITDAGYIDAKAQISYYDLFFEILKRILPLEELDAIIADFKRESEKNLGASSKDFSVSSQSQKKADEMIGGKPKEDHHEEGIGTDPRFNNLRQIIPDFLKKPKWLWGSVGVLCLISILVLSLIGGPPQSSTKYIEAQYLGSDLPIPALLNRHKLIQEMDEKLKSSGDIHTIALIGMGGAGKTTLARQYAHAQKSSVIWEINAETKSSLVNSFEVFAHALCQTDEEKKVLISLKDATNFAQKEEKITQLVRDHLKKMPNWLLIYDNVERFSDIQKYFPSDANFWGKGRVIVTTQDTHIQNNSYIKDAIWVGELSPDEKLSLFLKIMNPKKPESFNTSQQAPTKIFLEKIPSFPLDVSVAAYYIKATNIDQDSYLKYLSDYSQSFSALQKNILKESSGYTKTRYQIITLSLEKLIGADKDFADLLLLISLLDSKNIPRDLLERYKGKLVVDNFIYNLKKYSLIVNPLTQSTAPLSHIFIHRSTQDIGLAYLADFLKLTKDSPLLKAIVYTLDDYLDQAIEAEDFPKMQVMAGHLGRFLNHPDLLTDFEKGLLVGKSGCLYYFLNNEKSHQMIAGSLKILKHVEDSKGLSSEDQLRLVRSLVHIGAVCTELRLYLQAQELLEKAINIYVEGGLKNGVDLPWALSHLGNIYRRLGNYEKAMAHLEESVRLSKQHGVNNKLIARTLSYLGSVYRGLGSYQKSIGVLEEALNLYKKYYSDNHFRVGWILTQLGYVYRKLGDYQKAKEYLESGLLISKKYLPEDHKSMYLLFAYLGNCLRELGDYEKSQEYLEKSLKIHESRFDENHVRMGWVLFHLASTYKALGKQKPSQELLDRVLRIYDGHCEGKDIETARYLRNMAEIYLGKDCFGRAENLAQRSLKVLQDHNHLEAYMSLEILGEIYLKQSIQSLSAKKSQESQAFKNQAIDQFNQALKIIDQCFPENCAHRKRVLSKIKNLTDR